MGAFVRGLANGGATGVEASVGREAREARGGGGGGGGVGGRSRRRGHPVLDRVRVELRDPRKFRGFRADRTDQRRRMRWLAADRGGRQSGRGDELLAPQRPTSEGVTRTCPGEPDRTSAQVKTVAERRRRGVARWREGRQRAGEAPGDDRGMRNAGGSQSRGGQGTRHRSAGVCRCLHRGWSGLATAGGDGLGTGGRGHFRRTEQWARLNLRSIYTGRTWMQLVAGEYLGNCRYCTYSTYYFISCTPRSRPSLVSN